VTSVTVSVLLTIRRRGGRKQIIGPNGAVARPGDSGAHVYASDLEALDGRACGLRSAFARVALRARGITRGGYQFSQGNVPPRLGRRSALGEADILGDLI